MSGSIRLSPKHGVNPSMAVCFFCNEPNGEIILPGRLKEDAEAPRYAVWNMDPCDKCKEYMKQGIICISVLTGSDEKNPYRTGGWVVVKEDVMRKIIQPEDTLNAVMEKRVCFIDDQTWDMIGLPRVATAATAEDSVVSGEDHVTHQD